MTKVTSQWALTTKHFKNNPSLSPMTDSPWCTNVKKVFCLFAKQAGEQAKDRTQLVQCERSPIVWDFCCGGCNLLVAAGSSVCEDVHGRSDSHPHEQYQEACSHGSEGADAWKTAHYRKHWLVSNTALYWLGVRSAQKKKRGSFFFFVSEAIYKKTK